MELSIVLIIIGLITAGVISSTSILKHSKLRATVTQFDSYKVAHFSFLEVFNFLPGDFPYAEQYWDDVENGNGNGKLENWGSATFFNEVTAYWEHLQKADMISGNYTGESHLGKWNNIGINIPRMPFSHDSGIMIDTHPTTNIYSHSIGEGAYFSIASEKESCNALLNGSLFTTSEAQSIDAKFDDGIPSSGLYYVLRGTYNNLCYPAIGCVLDDYRTAPSTKYDLSDKKTSCRMFYWIRK